MPKVVKKGKFADEDASDDDIKVSGYSSSTCWLVRADFDTLQDDWDASDDEEELAKKAAAAKPTGPAPPVRAKGATKKKIAEKEAAEQQRAEEAAARVSRPFVASELFELRHVEQ